MPRFRAPARIQTGKITAIRKVEFLIVIVIQYAPIMGIAALIIRKFVYQNLVLYLNALRHPRAAITVKGLMQMDALRAVN